MKEQALRNLIEKPLSILRPKETEQDFSEVTLEGHLRAQKLAYECAITIGQELQPGWSEKKVSDLMDVFLKDCGVKQFFHHSFAWFGERTKFQGINSYKEFMPMADRILREGEVVILDTAPILNGYTSDIGYSLCLGDNPDFDNVMDFLREQRIEIKNHFAKKQSISEIWKNVDEDIKNRGLLNCHALYPFSVLGHKVHKVSDTIWPDWLKPYRFGPKAYIALLSRGVFGELLSPDKNVSPYGLWAIEPHVGAANFGAKFEEILVVTPQEVYWLDDDVPHLK